MSSAGFDDQLGDFVNGTSARIGLADNAMLTFTVVEKKPNQVDLWWMCTHLPFPGDGQNAHTSGSDLLSTAL